MRSFPCASDSYVADSDGWNLTSADLPDSVVVEKMSRFESEIIWKQKNFVNHKNIFYRLYISFGSRIWGFVRVGFVVD